MTPEQFLAKLAKHGAAPGYLFVGQEGFNRKLCKDALIQRVLPEESRSDGLTQRDLEACSVQEVLDDARSLSLFARERLIWVGSAELALPRRVTSVVSDDEEDGKAQEAPLSEYLRSPTAGTVLVFECSRYGFEGEDRQKIERVQKFFGDIREVVEFRAFTPESIRFLAQQTAKSFRLKLAGAELAALVESVGGDALKLAVEIEKLSLYVGSDRAVTMEDLRELVPNASQSTIFALVNALGRRDRAAALRSLDILVREGEYLPLALTFLEGLLRLAVAAKENKIANAQQAQSFFQRAGIRIWRDRAEQVVSTANAFSEGSLRKAITLVFETDKKFREGYRDDKLVMECLIFSLTEAKQALNQRSRTVP